MEEAMAQEKIGAESQSLSSNSIMLGLSAAFLTYFLYYFMTLGNSIASPMIAADLNGMDLFSWAISLPALAMAFATMLFGKLSDMYGRRSILLTSLVFFMVGAILAALSQNFIFNIVARMINGLGMGALAALSFSVVGDMFDDPVKKSKWSGLLNIPAGIAATIVPILIGVIIDNLSWRYFFWATVPIVIVCMILIAIGVPGRTGKVEHKIDYIGAVFLAVASSCMILGVSFTDRQPLVSFHVLGLLVISLVFWILFIQIERKVKEPILDPQVFTNRTFLTAAICAFLSFFGFIGIMNYFPLFLQGVMGTSAKISGAMLTPFTMLLAFMGIPAGLLIAKTKRYKWMLVVSYAVLTAAMFILVLFTRATPLWLGVVVMIFGGIGVGSIPTINVLVVQFALPKRFRGVSVAAIFFVVALGMAVAPAIMGPAMNTTYNEKLKSLLPKDLDSLIGSENLKSIADPSVLMSANTMKELKSSFSKIEGQKPSLFNETVQAIRSALQSGLKVVFLIGSVALLIALLCIITIPVVSLDNEAEDKNP